MNELKFDDRLIKILEEEVLREKWKKKVKIVGIVIRKRISKKGKFCIYCKNKKI